MAKSKAEIANCLASELSNMVHELESGTLTKHALLNYFATMMIDAEMDEIGVSVLERKDFGQEGKDEARMIKMTLGY